MFVQANVVVAFIVKRNAISFDFMLIVAFMNINIGHLHY